MLERAWTRPALVVGVGVLALLLGVVWLHGRGAPDWSRPVVAPQSLGGVPVSTDPSWQQAHQQIVSGFTSKHPGHAFDQEYYAPHRLHVTSLMAYRGDPQDVPDLGLFARLHMDRHPVGDATCGTHNVVVCYRTASDLTLVLTVMGSGADEAGTVALLDEAWAAQPA